MKLEDEVSLVGYFVEQMQKDKKSIILTEVETNYGRPDIIQIFINNKLYKKRRLKTYTGQFSNEMSFAMTFLYGKSWVKFSTLQSFLHLYDTQFNKLVSNLLERELVDIKGENYIKSKQCREILLIQRVVAYEAKLFNWKYAIEQAQRHLWFTSESYIILPKKSQKTNVLIEERCKENEIGLVYFNEENFITKIKISKKRVINCPLIWKLNELLIGGDICG